MRSVVVAMLAMLLFALPAQAQEMFAAPEPTFEASAPPPIPSGWITVDGRHAQIHGHPENVRLLDELADHADVAIPELAERLGVSMGAPVQVFVAEDTAEFRDLQPGRPPEWADATAYPEKNSVFLRAPAARGPDARALGTVFDHELIHVLVGQAFAPNQPPRWLQEGLATAMANELGPEQADTLGAAWARGEWYPLDQLQNAFPNDARGASVAYAQSADFVAWVRDRSGDEGIRRLIDTLADGGTVDAAVYSATGLVLVDADREWRADYAKRAPFSGVSVLVDFAWIGLGGAAIYAFMRKRKRTRDRIRHMGEDEAKVAFQAAVAARRRASRRRYAGEN